MMKRIFVMLILSTFLLSSVLAVTCTPSSLTVTYNESQTGSSSIQCTNSGPNSTSISLTGETQYFSTTESVISQGGTKTIPLSFSSTTPAGLHLGSVVFGDGSSVPLAFYVKAVSQQSSPILVFPTSKVVSVQQGNEKTQNIIITVPSSYPRTITIQSVDLNPNVETIKLGDLNLGQIAPGNSIQIPIVFTGNNAQTGTYQTSLDIFAIDSQGQVNLPKVSLELQVASGINPSVNFSINELPTCSLNAVELNLNNTYALTCSRPNPNIEIHPVIDSFYLTGSNVEKTSTQFIYNFKAKKIGNTQVRAEFRVYNAMIGEPFTQDVRISNSGNSPIPGTIMNLIFFQEGKQKDKSSLSTGETTIQVIDNQTQSIIENAKLQMGGANINNTLTLEADKFYQIRAISPGYVDLVTSFNVTEKPLKLILNPNRSRYFAHEEVGLTSDVQNTTFFINNIEINNNTYTFTVEGNYTIKAKSDGYSTIERTIEVLPSVTFTSSPQPDEWSQGDSVTAELSQSSDWSIQKDGVNVASGTGKDVTFSIGDPGFYTLKSNGVTLASKQVESKSFFKKYWWVFVIVVAILILLFVRSGGEESIDTGFGGE